MKRRNTFIVIKSSLILFMAFMFLCLCMLTLPLNDEEKLGSVFLSQKRKLPIYCTENNSKQIAITFDAAWGSDKTEDIIRILKEEGITATFFLVGMWVDKNEALTKKISDEGFEIGTHSNTHPDFVKLSDSQIRLELSQSKAKIENITQKEVTLFRAPFGSYNNNVISISEELKLQTIQWDVDSLDWKGISASTISNNILKKVGSGSIILCHNNADHIVEALPSVIGVLKARGYEFVKVSDLLLKENYTIDNTGRQVSCA